MVSHWSLYQIEDIMSIGKTITKTIRLLSIPAVFYTGEQVSHGLSFNDLMSNGFVIAGEKDIAEREDAFFDFGFFIIARLLG
jgi:hypothetical protein